MRRIVFFTGTRAEYGLLRGLIRRVHDAGDVEAIVAVSGTHLSAAYGRTVSEIEADGFRTVAAGIDLTDNSPLGIARSMAQAVNGYANLLVETSADLTVVLGDRYETFCMATASTVLNVPIAHIHGGETTEGAMDESFRHSITKMAHLHFASCEPYRKRIIQLGEAPERVWNAGAPGVENVMSLDLLSEAEIRAFLGVPGDRPYFVSTYHPVTLEDGDGVEQVRRLTGILLKHPEYVTVFTGANADPGGAVINTYLADLAASDASFRFFTSLGVLRYLSAVKYCAGVIGNSSSGIIEAPSLGVPILDIGDRQKGRIRSEAVLHCADEPDEICRALEVILDSEFRDKASRAANPYEKAGTAAFIADTLRHHPLSNLLKKSFHDIDFKY